jgi:hypothetical protein
MLLLAALFPSSCHLLVCSFDCFLIPASSAQESARDFNTIEGASLAQLLEARIDANE